MLVYPRIHATPFCSRTRLGEEARGHGRRGFTQGLLALAPSPPAVSISPVALDLRVGGGHAGEYNPLLFPHRLGLDGEGDGGRICRGEMDTAAWLSQVWRGGKSPVRSLKAGVGAPDPLPLPSRGAGLGSPIWT